MVGQVVLVEGEVVDVGQVHDLRGEGVEGGLGAVDGIHHAALGVGLEMFGRVTFLIIVISERIGIDLAQQVQH